MVAGKQDVVYCYLEALAVVIDNDFEVVQRLGRFVVFEPLYDYMKRFMRYK